MEEQVSLRLDRLRPFTPRDWSICPERPRSARSISYYRSNVEGAVTWRFPTPLLLLAPGGIRPQPIYSLQPPVVCYLWRSFSAFPLLRMALSQSIDWLHTCYHKITSQSDAPGAPLMDVDIPPSAKRTRDSPEPEPPTKRRRIAESILSTALSVALVGTAVGYTAYRL